jgi:CRP/FNR family transcriptional regulator
MRRPAYGFEPFESCLSCAWRTESSFCGLGNEALAMLDRVSFVNVYPAESILFAEGQAARGLFLLCHGSARLTIASPDGKTLVLRIAHSGEVLGLSSVISGHDHKMTAETLEPSQIRFVKREDFARLIGEFADVCRRASMQLSAECEAETDQIRSIGLSRSAAERLAHLILSFAIESGRPGEGGIKVSVPMTHHDIAEMIGTSRETVTRLLKDFRDHEIIETRGSTMTIRNRAALEALVSL